MHAERDAAVAEWLAKADSDLLGAERMLSVAPALPDLAAFHSQQAVEKALKAYLVSNDHVFSKSHDLVALASLYAEHEPSFANLADAARSLTPFAVDIRYPGEASPPDEAEATELLAEAVRVVRFVHEHLPSGGNA